MVRAPAQQTPKDRMIRIFIISCYVRMITQGLWKFVDCDRLYCVGVAFFEICAILLPFFPHKPTKMQRAQLLFFAFCAMWDLFKYLFLDPYGIYLYDYMNVGVSLIMTLLTTKYYGRFSKGSWK
jgi:hypothetical protein